MNDEEKKILTDLIDNERAFHVGLAKTGMVYGACMAIIAALLAVGAEEVIRTDWSGSILLISAVILAFGITRSARNELKKRS